MQRASASREGNRTGPAGTGFSLEVPCSQVTRGISAESRDRVLFPGRVPGEQHWGDEPLVRKCCQVGSTAQVPRPQTAPEAKQSQLPLPQHRRLVLVLLAWSLRALVLWAVRVTPASFCTEPRDEQALFPPQGTLLTRRPRVEGPEGPVRGSRKPCPHCVVSLRRPGTLRHLGGVPHRRQAQPHH